MCGIAGAIELRGKAIDRTALEKMASLLAHRGPDDQGIHVAGSVGLAHRRLSIIDLSPGGHQPMASHDGSSWIVFNGEIYNFPIVRHKLEALGHSFTTRSDTEVLLKAYEMWGIDAPEHLNGMFAFAIWDGPRKRLFAARDRLGKKPFFYYHDADRFVFASELKALLAYPGVDRTVDPGAIDEYLSTLYIAAPRTIFRGVKKLLPAHCLLLEAGSLTTRPYWTLRFASAPASAPEGERIDQLEELFREAVKRRLISDVPLGAFLSGGIDSSAVVGMMARLSDRPVQTFTIGFEEEEFSEVEDARVVARHFATDHHECTVRADAIGILPDLVWHLDEPFGDSSAIPTYYVSKMARERVTVALAGDGGDELFAGYTRYLAAARSQPWSWLPRTVRRGVLAPLSVALPMAFPGRNLLYSIGHGSPEAPGYGLGLYPYIRERLYAPAMRAVAVAEAPGREARLRTPANGTLDRLSRLQYLDTIDYLPNDILTKVDRTSMAHALEVRAPLLDYEVVEYAASVPPGLKLHNGVSKYLFRQMCRRFLPGSVFEKRKQGFAIPKRIWFRADLRDHARERLLDRRTLARGYFDRKALEQVLDYHGSGQRDYSDWIWSLLVLEDWHRIYVDAESRWI